MLQVVQMCVVGLRAEAVRSFLADLLYVAWTLAFTSALDIPDLTLCGDVSQCLAMSIHALVSICADRKSRLMTSLQRSSGQPTWRMPSCRSL